MAVEYSGGTVKNSLDLQSAKNTIKEKLSRIILGIVLAGFITGIKPRYKRSRKVKLMFWV